MPSYEAIQEHIERARIARAVLLADLIAGAISATWNALRRVVRALVAAERAKDPDKVFTFEA